MATLNHRVAALEASSRDAQRIAELGPVMLISTEEAEAVYRQFMLDSSAGASLLNFPSDPVEAARWYMQIMRGERHPNGDVR